MCCEEVVGGHRQYCCHDNRLLDEPKVECSITPKPDPTQNGFNPYGIKITKFHRRLHCDGEAMQGISGWIFILCIYLRHRRGHLVNWVNAVSQSNPISPFPCTPISPHAQQQYGGAVSRAVTSQRRILSFNPDLCVEFTCSPCNPKTCGLIVHSNCP